MLTVTVSKEINGKTVKVSTEALNEDSTTISEFNSEVQKVIGRLFDKES